MRRFFFFLHQLLKNNCILINLFAEFSFSWVNRGWQKFVIQIQLQLQQPQQQLQLNKNSYQNSCSVFIFILIAFVFSCQIHLHVDQDGQSNGPIKKKIPNNSFSMWE